jgi:hypothetical protein
MVSPRRIQGNQQKIGLSGQTPPCHSRRDARDD